MTIMRCHGRRKICNYSNGELDIEHVGTEYTIANYFELYYNHLWFCSQLIKALRSILQFNKNLICFGHGFILFQVLPSQSIEFFLLNTIFKV